MTLLIKLAPFLLFAMASALDHTLAGLWLAAAVACLDLIIGRMRGGALRALDLGTVVLFTSIALVTTLAHVSLSIGAVRTIVDAGLLAIILASVMAGRPFTMQYAPSGEHRITPGDQQAVRMHTVISLGFAVALLLIVAADVAFTMKVVTARQVTIMIVAAGFGAFRFAKWYVRRFRASAPLS